MRNTGREGAAYSITWRYVLGTDARAVAREIERPCARQGALGGASTRVLCVLAGFAGGVVGVLIAAALCQ